MTIIRSLCLLFLLGMLLPCVGQIDKVKGQYSYLMHGKQKFYLENHEKREAKEYQILLDDINNCFFQFSNKGIVISEPTNDSIDNHLDWREINLETDGLGKVFSLKPKLFVKGNFKNIISYGEASSLLQGNYKNIKTLILLLDFGRPHNIANLKNLKHVSFQTLFHHDGLERRQGKLSDLVGFNVVNYQGDPYIMDEILDLKELETLDINQNFGDYSAFQTSVNELTFIDLPMSKIFSLPNLERFGCAGEVLLPVNFQDFEKFELLMLSRCFSPELANLALVMYHFNKDTSSGNWAKFLSLVDIEKQFVIPDNDIYQSYYKNGQLLCSGSYENGKPNGEWNFWYDDGSICQRREYENGEKTGDWFALNRKCDSHESIPDTIMERHYKNDRLIYLKSKKQDKVFECYNYEFSFESDVKTEFWITRDVNNSINIKKRSVSIRTRGHSWRDTLAGVGDTLAQLKEDYKFTPSNWSYMKTWKCSSFGSISEVRIETLHLKGDLGKRPSYNAKSSAVRQISKYGLFYRKNESIIDFENRTFLERQYKNIDKTDQIKLEYETVKEIPSCY